TAFRMRSLYALHRSLTVTITAIQPRLRLSETNRLGFQPSMAISERMLLSYHRVQSGEFNARRPIASNPFGPGNISIPSPKSGDSGGHGRKPGGLS
ncbi:MAG: hypothetical protein KZQ65_05630, partial [Candidatus Thiodiazotropha sp. (ex Gloverina cf. vestifex)]|nr:hypothetical protein [Candidatus Thiodiazotropha sp. (ex Gloverina cf. vestifex)]